MKDYTKNPVSRQIQETETALKHGYTSVTAEGVDIYAPMTMGHKQYTAGTKLKGRGGGDVMTYDGSIRNVDMSVMNGKLTSIKKKNKILEDFAIDVIDSGNDNFLYGIIGENMDFLEADLNGGGDLALKYLEYAGISKFTLSKESRTQDSRPSVLKYLHPHSDNFRYGIMKLKWVLEHSSIEFSNIKVDEPVLNRPAEELAFATPVGGVDPTAQAGVTRGMA